MRAMSLRVSPSSSTTRVLRAVSTGARDAGTESGRTSGDGRGDVGADGCPGGAGYVYRRTKGGGAGGGNSGVKAGVGVASGSRPAVGGSEVDGGMVDMGDSSGAVGCVGLSWSSGMALCGLSAGVPGVAGVAGVVGVAGAS